ncbi:hypothetical protein [Peijinzhouia sedimentorum]
MRNIQILILFLFSIGISAQNIPEINSDLKLSDSLTNITEVRIYKIADTTNYSSLYRMFKDESKKWNIEFYKHYAKIKGKSKLRTEKLILTAKNNMDSIYRSLVRSYILELPNQSDIEWKMIRRGTIEKIDRFRNGKEVITYELFNRSIHYTEGVNYKIQAKDWNGKNEFEYSNPDKYLNYYPDIDELNYICEILNTIRNEFGIWKK